MKLKFLIFIRLVYYEKLLISSKFKLPNINHIAIYLVFKFYFLSLYNVIFYNNKELYIKFILLYLFPEYFN